MTFLDLAQHPMLFSGLLVFCNSEDHIEHDSLNIQLYNIVNIFNLDLNVLFPLIQPPKPILGFRKTYCWPYLICGYLEPHFKAFLY